jgi:hypothetical protein
MIEVNPLEGVRKSYKILIECDLKTSEKCRGQYMKEYRFVLESRQKNHGKDICTHCYNKSIAVGKMNGASLHDKNETFFENIDTELKSYLLGLIAGDGSLENTGKRLILYANKTDSESLILLKNAVAPTITLFTDENCMCVKINSTRIVSDVCKHLKISPGKKSHSLSLPDIEPPLLWHFLRGLVDSDGSISTPYSGCTSPRCKITTSSQQLIQDIKELCLKHDINSCVCKMDIYFVGKHALSFLNKIYSESSYQLTRKYKRYTVWKTWIPNYGTAVRPRKNAPN